MCASEMIRICKKKNLCSSDTRTNINRDPLRPTSCHSRSLVHRSAFPLHQRAHEHYTANVNTQGKGPCQFKYIRLHVFSLPLPHPHLRNTENTIISASSTGKSSTYLPRAPAPARRSALGCPAAAVKHLAPPFGLLPVSESYTRVALRAQTGSMSV